MNLNNGGSLAFQGGNFQTEDGVVLPDSSQQTADCNMTSDYNLQSLPNGPQLHQNGFIATHVDKRLTEGKGNCPQSTKPMSVKHSIGPMAKREDFALALRRQRKDNIISSKRAKQQHNLSQSIRFRALSVNIRGLNSVKKQEALAKLIEEHRATLVSLQETKLTKRLWISNFHHSQSQLKRNGGSVCASSLPGSKPIKALGQAIAWLMLVHQGVPIHVISVYVEPGNQTQADKVHSQVSNIIRSLVRRTKKPRIILSGDFNQDRERYDAIAQAFGLTPALQKVTQTHSRGGALDQLYSNLEIISAEATIIDNRISDHCAIVCELKFTKCDFDYVKDRDLPTRRYWKLKEAAASAQTAKCLLQRKDILSSPATQIVQQQVKPQKQVQRWYEACKQKNGDHHGNADIPCKLGERMDNLTWKQALLKLEKLHREGAWKEFHAMVRALTKLKPGCTPVTGLILLDQTLFDPGEIEECLADYYGTLYHGTSTTQNCQLAIKPQNPIQIQEVSEAIDKTNFQKGLGTDLFGGRVLEKDPLLRQRVTEEIKVMLNRGTFPDYFREGRLVALSKRQDRSIVDMDDIRPIIVRSHLTKVSEKVIKSRLEKFHPHILRTKNAQTGFKPGKSTGINITRVLRQLHPGKGKRGKKPVLLLIDLKKAFDSIDKQKLFQILQNRCLNDEDRWMVQLIRELHTRNIAQIGTQKVQMNKGVMQGSVLAPLLFNVYFEEVILKCPTLALKYEHSMALAYADDLLVLCKNTKEAEKVIGELEAAGKDYNLIINKQKSQIICGDGGSPILGIPIVSEAKYLGILIKTNRLQQKKSVRDQIDRNLTYISCKLKNANNDVKETLLEAYAKSLLIYFGAPMRAAGLWKQKEIKQIEQQLYRRIHRVPNDIGSAVLMNIASNGQTIASVIESLARKLHNQAQGCNSLENQWNLQRQEKERTKHKKLYIPRPLTETILALMRGRTILFFGHRHYCNLHQCILDDDHLKQCSLIRDLLPNQSLLGKLRDQNIHEWQPLEIMELISQTAFLKSTLEYLTYTGSLKIKNIMEESVNIPATLPEAQLSVGHQEDTSMIDVSNKRKRGRPRVEQIVATGHGSLLHYYQKKSSNQ